MAELRDFLARNRDWQLNDSHARILPVPRTNEAPDLRRVRSECPSANATEVGAALRTLKKVAHPFRHFSVSCPIGSFAPTLPCPVVRVMVSATGHKIRNACPLLPGDELGIQKKRRPLLAFGFLEVSGRRPSHGAVLRNHLQF